MADILVLYDEAMTEHDMGRWHPEKPDRLRAIVEHLDARSVPGVRWAHPTPAPLEAIRCVHQSHYLDSIIALRGRTAQLDPDTSVSPGSVPAMFLAAGAAVDGVEAVVSGAADRACALVRPPGHHAESNRAMGFCLVNNIAVAAEHALKSFGCRRVLVVDWDVHHGNGTQNSFYGRSDVLYFSSHRFPFFPGSGWFNEVGEGAGTGYTVNVPLPYRLGDAEHIAVYRDLLVPIADAYRPDLVLVSAGYDSHERDPLGGMRMSDDGFATLAGTVRDIADRHAGGRLVVLLEGGYDLDALSEGVHRTVSVLAGDTPPRLTASAAPGFDALVQRVRDHHHTHWPL